MTWFITPTQARAMARKPALSNRIETSDEAARAIELKRTALQRIVLDAIGALGGEATADEIEALLDIDGSSIRPRLVELCEANVLERTERTRLTRRGRRAFTYTALPSRGGGNLL